MVPLIRVTHNFAVLMHNFAQKTAKERRNTHEMPPFLSRRVYASKSTLGEVMVHNIVNNLL